MPFDLSRLMPTIEAMADYYAHEIAPDLLTSSQEAWDLIQQVEQDALRQAAHRLAVRALALPWEDPSKAFLAPSPSSAYRVLGSDGSAIDPDPHFPARYAVIHTALAGMGYAPPEYWSRHQATLLFRRDELEITPPNDGETIHVEGPVIDTLRAYRELAVLLEETRQLPGDVHDRPLLAMTDAILLWTHRGTGPGHERFRDHYLVRSVALLEQFRQASIPVVSFMSLPRHREVVYTMMSHYCRGDKHLDCSDCSDAPEACKTLRGLQDRHLFGFLPEGARSALFRPIYRGDTRWRLPKEAWDQDPRLAFFYLNTGSELARVELPLWIQEQGLLDLVHGILLDQCQPLRAEAAGYPVVLSMAHQEAVLTTRDRQAVQWMIEEALARRQIFPAPSAKARMKGA